jgi:hypothetical protein
MYSAIIAEQKTGKEKIVDEFGKTISDITAFWQWAHSNLINNAERGVFAEYLVACAIGSADKCRIEWDKFDLKTKEGIFIDVKSSAYIQSWNQQKISNLRFDIRETIGIDSVTNIAESTKKRQAEVYVFCVHKHQEQATINPLDLKQWDFYVLSTNVLNKTMRSQKSIGLKKLMTIGAVRIKYENLLEAIRKAR